MDYHPRKIIQPGKYVGIDRRGEDPVGRLSRHLDYVCTTAVDPLQIAAALETDGITDRLARDEYGYNDVFELAEELFHRVPRRLTKSKRSLKREGGWGELLHGPLFVMPAVFYPAIFALIGPQSMVMGMVLGTAVGWVWSMGMSWIAYRLIGREAHDEAADVLRKMALVGILLVGIVGVLLAGAKGLNLAVAALPIGQMMFQMAASILMVYHRELWLFACMVPGALGALVYWLLGAPPEYTVWVVGLAMITSLICFAVAYWVARGPGSKGKIPRTLGKLDLMDALQPMGYAALSATLMLYENARYATSHLDLSLSVAPLALCMGVLEWQSRIVRERSAQMLRQTRFPKEFVPRAWYVFGQGLGVCVVAIGLLSVVLVTVLGQLDLMSPQGLILFLAHLLLGASFFVNYILMAHRRMTWVLASLAAVLGIYMLSLNLPLELWATPSHSVSYLISNILLLAALLWGLRGSLGQIRNYR
jgi:hypothetical protein